MRSDHHRLLAAAGFHATTEVDVTPAFAATAAAWLAETEPHAEELARLEAPGAFEQRQADRCIMLDAINAGMVCRTLVLAEQADGQGRVEAAWNCLALRSLGTKTCLGPPLVVAYVSGH